MGTKLHIRMLRRGGQYWNAWRREHYNTRSYPYMTDVSGGDFSDLDLDNADLGLANAAGANFSGSHLSVAKFHNANLEGADLSNTYLAIADFTGANLKGVHFNNARVHATVFNDVDLSSAIGLDSIIHEWASSISVSTIYKSHGKIPESFLRGCGVPENFIRFIPSLVNSEEGIQFYSCFISYSHKDEEFARRLHGRMRDAHLRVWFAPEDIEGGKKLHEQIETAIRVYDKLLIVLSEASLQSEWVMDELRKGFKAERDTRKRKLFPVRLTDYKTLQTWVCRDSISGKDLAEEVRQYFIPDFSRWKEYDQFEAAVARLLNDLKADTDAS